MASNFFDQFDNAEDSISAAPEPGLVDRFRLNFESGNRSNTILGATYDASTPSRQADRARFDRNYEAYPEWQGFLEGTTALAGQIAGTAASPENFLPIGLGEKILVAGKMGVTGLWAKIFAGAVDAAATNAVTDAAIQGIDIAGDNAETFDPQRYAIGILLGAGIGGAAGGATYGGGKVIDRFRSSAPENMAPSVEAGKGANFFDALDDNAPSPNADTANVAAQIAPAQDTVAPIIEAPAARAPIVPDAEPVPPIVIADVPVNTVVEAQPARVSPETLGERLSDQAADARGVERFGSSAVAERPREAALIAEPARLSEELPASPSRSETVGVEIAKDKQAPIVSAAKDVGDFMMSSPSAGLRAQRTRATEAASQVQSAATHVQRIRETADALADALNITASRQGRISGGKRVLGTFDNRDSVVRVRSLDDFDTLTHEYGHHIDKHVPDVKDFIKQNSKALSVLDYDPVAGRDYEGFAEFFRLWITNREYIKKTLPDLADKFGKLMDEKAPEMSKAINDATSAWDQFLTAPSTVAVKSTIVSSKKDGWFKSAQKDLKKSGVGGTIADVLQRIYTFSFDDLNPVNRAVSYLKDLHFANTGRALDINTSSDPYKLARMSRGAYAAGHMDLMYGVAPYRGINPESPSLRDAIVEATGKPNALSGWDEDRVADFGSYLWSRRALGEWERYRNGEIPNPPDKLTNADHTANVADLEKQFPAFASAAAKVHEFSRALWKKKYDAGLIDLETFEKGNLIKDYVPGLRDFSADSEVKANGKSAGRGASMKGGLAKRFKGSKRDVVNPLESLAADAYETSMTIARNDVIKSLHRLSLNAGPGGGAIAELVPAKEMRANMVDPIEAVQSAAKNAGMSDADITVLRDAVESAVGSEKAAVFRPATINEKGEPIVFFRDGGDLKALRLADSKFGHEMYSALTMMGRTEKNFWLDMVAIPARILRAGITLSPEFIAANFVRDQFMAAVMYGKPLQRVGATLQGAVDDIIGSDAAKSYSRMFGISGGAETASLSEVMARRDIDGLRRRGWVANRLSSFRGVLETAEIAETATRVGLFRTFQNEAKKRGLDDYEALLEASWRARDYMDFDRRGSGMGALSRVTPFLNASMQGLDKASRHMIAPLAKKVLGMNITAEDQLAMSTAVKTWARLSALVVGSLSLYALMSKNEDHDEISETTRATHWMIKTGDKWTAVPKPFEMAAAINLGEAIYDMWASKDPKAMNRWGDSLFETIIPPSIMEGNPLIKSYFELKSNSDFFTKAPIVPDQLQGMEPFLQYTSRTSALSKQLGRIFNQPPVVIDHLITAHLGSWGRNALSMYDLAQPDAPGFAWDDAAISRRFIKDAARGAQSSTMFWKMAGQREGTLEGKVKSWQAMVESGDAAGAADYFAKLDKVSKAYVAVSSLDADARRLHPMVRARNAIQAIGAVRREMASGKLVDHDGEMIEVTPAERTAADDVLSSLSMALARNGLKEAGVEGWAQREPISEDGFYRELMAVNPGIAERLGDAYANKKVWTAEATNDAWPEVRDRALADGSAAFVGDLVSEVKGGGLALEGMKRPRKKKPELAP